MKKSMLLACILLPILAFGQGSRYDSTLNTASYINGIKALSPMSGALVQVCTAPANATPCTNLATIYTDSTLITPCNGSNGCSNPATADANGNFGAWFLSGQYQYTYTYKGQAFGPISVTAGLASGSSVNFCSSSGTYVVGSTCYANIAAALAAAGSTGWVSIPKSYAGADTYVSGTYKNVIDLRGNFFGVYQYIAPSRPITGYPLGNDLALDVDGPADLYLANGDLGSAITTTSTLIVAANPTTITVGDSTKFSTAAGYARIDPGKGDGVDDFCTLNSIPDSTHMNVTCIYNHSGTVDVWQKGNFVVKGFAALDLVPTQPAHLSAYQFPFYIGSSFASLMSIGVNPSDPWPHNGIAFSEALTGMSAGGANHFPSPGDLVLRNSDFAHAFRVQDSLGATMLYVPDGHVGFTTYIQDDSGANPASQGAIRLRNGAQIWWRNATNSGDIELAVDSNNRTVSTAPIASLGGSIQACNGAGGNCASISNSGLSANRAYTTPDIDGQISLLKSQDCGTTTSCSHTDISGTLKLVKGSVALSSGTPSTATVTGFSPVFTSSSSFVCTASNATTQANPVKVVNASSSSITITGPNTVTDVVNYICVGN